MAQQSPELVDLTYSPPKKRSAPESAPTAQRVQPASTARSFSDDKPKARKSTVPHALLWICASGKGQSRSWKTSALKVIGVYASKEDAEAKKQRVMSVHQCGGNGDIIVGDNWEDEIDLVVRPVGELDV